MPSPEYMIMYTSLFTPELLLDLGITPFLQTDSKGREFFYVQVDRTLPGFRQAGLHAHQRVVQLLENHGCYQTQPCLFTHVTDDIHFCLVVDDYGVKYTHIDQFHRLIAVLSKLHHVKASPIATTFLGFTIRHDRLNRLIILSMPNYIPNMLLRFRPNGVRPAKSPSIYAPPTYGSTAPQAATLDSSDPATALQIKEIQEVVGSLLYYARALDSTMLPAVQDISSRQSVPTQDVVAAVDRLLGYCFSHPDHELHVRPSHMLLQTQSDASYLSLPRSGSKSGGHHTFADHDPDTINAPIDVGSSRIPITVSSAADSEFCAAYGNARSSCFHRSTARNIGYPQPPTPIFCDNECAIGLAHGTVKAKRSKSMDMRLTWLSHRVANNQFYMPYRPSSKLLADFYTKPLPVHRHQEMAPFFVHKPC